MRLTYSLTQKKLRAGALTHYVKRKFFLNILTWTALTIHFSVMFSFDNLFRLIPIYIIIGLILCAFPYIYAWRRPHPFQKGITEIPHSLTVTEAHLHFHTPFHKNEIPFSDLVDVITSKKGTLVYQQKDSFYWIPADAVIESGTWIEFVKLMKNKVIN